jgi:hypothetical protein
MANIKYFADLPNGEVAEFSKVDYRSRNDIRAWNGAEWLEVTRSITFKSNPSRHECDARCINATGRTMNCECSCGGKNHGRGAFQCEAA